LTTRMQCHSLSATVTVTGSLSAVPLLSLELELDSESRADSRSLRTGSSVQVWGEFRSKLSPASGSESLPLTRLSTRHSSLRLGRRRRLPVCHDHDAGAGYVSGRPPPSHHNTPSMSDTARRPASLGASFTAPGARKPEASHPVRDLTVGRRAATSGRLEQLHSFDWRCAPRSDK